MIKKSMCIVAMEEHLMEKLNPFASNNFARKVIVFGVDNSSSSHGDNQKNNFFNSGWRRYF